MPKKPTKKQVAATIALATLGTQQVLPVVQSAYATSEPTEIPSTWLTQENQAKFASKDSMEYALNNIFDQKGVLRLAVQNFVGPMTLTVFNASVPVDVETSGEVNLTGNVDASQKAIIEALETYKKELKDTKLVLSTTDEEGFVYTPKDKEVDWLKAKAPIYKVQVTETKDAHTTEEKAVQYTTGTTDLLESTLKATLNTGKVSLIETTKGYVPTKELDLKSLPKDKDTKVIQVNVANLTTQELALDTDVPMSSVELSQTDVTKVLPDNTVVDNHVYDVTLKPKDSTFITGISTVDNKEVPFDLDAEGIHLKGVQLPEGKLKVKASQNDLKKAPKAEASVNIKGTWKDASKVKLDDVLKTIEVTVPADANQIQVSVNNKEVTNQRLYTNEPVTFTLPMSQSLQGYGVTYGQSFDITVKAGSLEDTQTITVVDEPKVATETSEIQVDKETSASKEQAVVKEDKQQTATDTTQEGTKETEDTKESTEVKTPSVQSKAQLVQPKTKSLLTQAVSVVPDETIINAPLDEDTTKSYGLTNAWKVLDETTPQSVARLVDKVFTFADERNWVFGVRSDTNAEDIGAIVYRVDTAGNQTHQLVELGKTYKNTDIIKGDYARYFVRYFNKEGVFTSATPLISLGNFSNTYLTGSLAQDADSAYVYPANVADLSNSDKGDFYLGIVASHNPSINIAFPFKETKTIEGVKWYNKEVPSVDVTATGPALYSIDETQARPDEEGVFTSSRLDAYKLKAYKTKEDFITNKKVTIDLAPVNTGQTFQELEINARSVPGHRSTQKVKWNADAEKPVIEELYVSNEGFVTKNDSENILTAKRDQDEIRVMVGDTKVKSYVNAITNANRTSNANTDEGLQIHFFNGDELIMPDEEGYITINKTGIYYVEVINQLGVSSGKVALSDVQKSPFKSPLFIKDADAPETNLQVLDKDGKRLNPVNTYTHEDSIIDLYNQEPVLTGKVVDKGTDRGVLRTVDQVNNLKDKVSLKNFYKRADKEASLVDTVNIKNTEIAKETLGNGVYAAVTVYAEDMVKQTSSATVKSYAVDTLKPQINKVTLKDGITKEQDGKLFISTDDALQLTLDATDPSNETNVSSGVSELKLLTGSDFKEVDSTQTLAGTLTIGNKTSLNGVVAYLQVLDNATNRSERVSLSQALGFKADLPIVYIEGTSTSDITLAKADYQDTNKWYKDTLKDFTIEAKDDTQLQKVHIDLNGQGLDLTTNEKEFKTTLATNKTLKDFFNANVKAGSNTLTITPYNVLAEKGSIAKETFFIDNDKPTGDLVVDRTPGNTTVVDNEASKVTSRQALTATIQAQDALSGLAGVQVSGINIKGTEVKIALDKSTWVLPEDLVHITELEITDNVGHTTIVKGDGYTYIVDKTKPTIDVNVPKATYEKEGTHYFADTPVIQAKVTDNIEVKDATGKTQGMKTTKVQPTAKEATLTVTELPEGVHNVVFEANDAIVEDKATSEVFKIAVDKTAPTITKATLKGTTKVHEDSLLTNEKSLNLDVTASDVLSGVKQVEVLVQDATHKESVIIPNTDGTFDLTKNGVYSVRATDNVGNVATYSLADIVKDAKDKIIFDTMKPSVSAKLTGSLVPLTDDAGKTQVFTNKPFNVELQASDNIALASTEVQVNGKATQVTWKDGKAILTLDPTAKDATGKIAIVLTAKDVAGNTATTTVQEVYVDTYAPVLRSLSVVSGDLVAKNDKTLFKDKVVVQFNGLDTFAGMSTSGITAIHIKDDKGSETTIKPKENFTIDKTGVYAFRIEDALGNISQEYSFKELYPQAKSNNLEKYDIEPVTSIIGTDEEGNNVDTKRVKDNVKVTVTPKDNVQVDTLTIKVNGQVIDGATFETKDLKSSTTGVYNVEATLVDTLGQVNIQTQQFKVDASKPSIKESVATGITGEANGVLYFNDKVVLTAELQDGLDSEGYKDIKVYNNDESQPDVKVKDNKATIELTEAGEYSFDIEDTVGHKVAGVTLADLLSKNTNKLVLDNEKPTATLDVEDADYSTDKQDWYKSGPDTTITAADNEGVQKVALVINGKVVETVDVANEKTATIDFSLAKHVKEATDTGLLAVKVIVTDVAKNQTEVTKDIYVDTQAPELAVLGIADVYTNNTDALYANKEVNVTLGLSDLTNDSGVALLEIYNEDGEVIQTLKEPKSTELLTIKETSVVKFKLTDNVGNTTDIIDLTSLKTPGDFKPKSNKFVIDTVPPVIEKEVIEEENGNKQAKITIKEAHFNPSETKVTLDGKALTVDNWTEDSEGVHSIVVTLADQGLRALSVTTTDLAGNTTKDEEQIQVNKDIEAGSIAVNWLDQVKENGYYNTERKADIVITEPNFSKDKTVVQDNGKALDVKWQEVSDGTWATQVTLSDDGSHRLQVFGTDTYDNAYKPYDSGDFIIDKINPELALTGVENQGLYTGDTKINVQAADANFDRVEWSITGIELPVAHWTNGNQVGTVNVEQPKASITSTVATILGTSSLLSTIEAHADEKEDKEDPSKGQPRGALSTNDEAFAPIQGSNLTSDDIKQDDKVYVYDTETNKVEDVIVTYPTGNPDSAGNEQNTSTGETNSTSTGETGTTGKESTTENKPAPDTETDSVNNDPNNNQAGTFKANGTSTEPSFTIPSIPEVREYDGGYQVTVTAYDKAGNTTTQTLTYGVRRFGTTFAPTYAGSNQFVAEKEGDKFTLTAINLETSEETALIQDEDFVIESNYKNDSGQTISNYTIETDKLVDGNYEGVFKYAGTDEEAAKIPFTVDTTAPTIKVTGVKDNSRTRGKEQEVTIKVKDELSPDLINVYLMVNDNFVELKQDKEDTTVYRVVLKASDKPMNLKVTATDSYGNELVKEVKNVQVGTNKTLAMLVELGAYLSLALAAGVFLFSRKGKDNDDNKR